MNPIIISLNASGNNTVTVPANSNQFFCSSSLPLTNVYDTTGTVTSVGFAQTAGKESVLSIGAGNHAATAGSTAESVGLLAWMNAQGAALNTGATVNGTLGAGVYEWSGLTPGDQYQVWTYGLASSGTANLFSTVNGSDQLSHPVALNYSLVNLHSAVAADVNGKITVQVWQDSATAPFAATGLIPASTGPALSSPTGTATGSTTANGTVSTDTGTGTLYYLASTNTTETASTIKATGASQAVSATGSQSVSVTGLSPSTVYYLHYYQEDASANPSNVVDSASFTTSAATSAPSISDIVINSSALALYGADLSGTSPTIAIAAGSVTVNQANVVATGTSATADYTVDNGTTQLPLYSTSANVSFTSSSGNASITTSLPTASGYSVIVAGTSFNVTSGQSIWAEKTSPATGDQSQIPNTSTNGAAVTADPYGVISLLYTSGGSPIAPPYPTDSLPGVVFWDIASTTRTSPQTINVSNNSFQLSVSSVSVPTSQTFGVGGNIDLTVNLNANGTVSGSPRIAIDIGGVNRYATYLNGSGTSALLFRYTVQSGDLDTNGITVGTTIDPNLGSIVDVNGNALYYTLSSVGSTTGVLVDGVAPAIAINSLSTTNTAPTVTGTCNDNTATLTLVVNSVTYHPTVSYGTWSQTLPTLSIASYPMTLDAVDTVGNNATQATGTLTIHDASTVLDNSHYKYFINNGGSGKSFNELAVSFYKSLGAASDQFNLALKQAQAIGNFIGLSPVDRRNGL